MNWQEYSALLALGFAMSFSPGPNTTLSTALAANRGLRGALLFVSSVPLGWGVLMTVCALGLGGLMIAVPAVVWLVKGVGCVYLLWLAWKISMATTLTQVDNSRLNVTFLQGAALQFINIKAWMFAISVVAGWLIDKPDFWQRFALLLPTLMMFAFVSNLAYALVGASLRGWLTQGKRLLWFNRSMAAVLVATAVWMLAV